MAQDSIFEPLPGGKEASVHFENGERDLARQMAEHIRKLLTEGDEAGETRALFPPAYGDDWARQVEFDRLVREDLSASHLAAIEMLLELLDADTANTDEIETFMRAMNQIRLVVANWLSIDDDTDDSDFPPDHPKHDTWRIYQYLGYMQSQALDALLELDPFPEP